MNILFVTHYTDMYGANMSMCNLITEYKKRGINAEVLCPCQGRLIEQLDKMDIKSYVVPYRRCDTLISRGIVYGVCKTIICEYINRKQLRAIENTLDINKFDIIHSNSICTPFGAMLSMKYKIPHIWHLREYLEEDYNLKVLMTPIIRKLYKNTDRFIAISKSIREKYSDRIASDKIKLIYNGVRYNKQSRVNDKKFIFVIIGLVTENKGTYEAVEAFGQAASSCPNAELWVIGGGMENENTEYVKKIYASVKLHHAEDKIKFLGYRSDVFKLLPRIKCGLMCSKKEAFGRVTIEYMQNKIIVIGSNSGGTAEIIDDNVSGFLYKQGNVQQLTERIKYVYDNYEALTSLINSAYEKAVDFFSIERCANEIVDLYEDTINKTRRE